MPSIISLFLRTRNPFLMLYLLNVQSDIRKSLRKKINHEFMKIYSITNVVFKGGNQGSFIFEIQMFSLFENMRCGKIIELFNSCIEEFENAMHPAKKFSYEWSHTDPSLKKLPRELHCMMQEIGGQRKHARNRRIEKTCNKE